jgi:hypothetical protein
MNLSEFEQLCNALSTNPTLATNQITAFREKDEAHGLCMNFLHESNNPEVQFQILSVLQYTSLKNWARFDVNDRNNIRSCLWSKILGAHASMPQYVLGKAYQVFALTWKCGWDGEPEVTKAQLFDTIQSNLLDMNTPESIRVGAELLCVTLEEFGSRTSAQIGAPLEFHRLAHLAFEKYGLQQSFQIALRLLSSVIGSLKDNTGAVMSVAQCSAIQHTARLLETILQWDFGCPDVLRMSKGKGNGGDLGSGLITPPISWAPHLLQPNLVAALTTAYTHLLTIAVQPNPNSISTSNKDEKLLFKSASAAASTVWELLISLASISGPCIKAHPCPSIEFLSASIQAATISCERCSDPTAIFFQPMSAWAGDNAVDELRSETIRGIILLIQRLLGNWKLHGLCSTTHTQGQGQGQGQGNIFDALLTRTLQLLHTLSNELRVLSKNAWHRIQGLALDPIDQQGVALFGVCDMMLDGWRGEACTALLDTWAMIVEDPALCDTSTSSTLLTEQQRSIIVSSSRAIFDQLYQAVLYFSLYDALEAMNDDEDGDIEEIVMRNLDDFIAAICVVGRSQSTKSISIILGTLIDALTMANNLASVQQVTQTSAIHILETCRISNLFLSRLIVDYDDACSSSYGSGSDSVDMRARISMEIPSLLLGSVPGLLSTNHTILTTQILSPSVLINTTNGGQGQRQGLFATMYQALQIQTIALSQCRELSSPLVVKLLLEFFASYFLIYVDPDIDMYDATCPGAQIGLLNIYSSSHNTIDTTNPEVDLKNSLESIFNSCYQFLCVLPLEEDVVNAVASLVTSASRLIHRVNTVILLPSVQNIFHMITGTDCRLNAHGLHVIWRAMGSLAVRCSDPAPFTTLLTSVNTRISALPTQSHGMFLCNSYYFYF